MDCVFCKIVNKGIGSHTIFEDKIVVVFLDIKPDSNGHIIIIPKKHIVDISDIDLETMNHINTIVKKMNKKIVEKLRPDGVIITQENGCEQSIKHYHTQIIPVYERDYPLIDLEDIYELLK